MTAFVLRCNSRMCNYATLRGKGYRTKCGHVYCEDCATKVFSSSNYCAICNTELVEGQVSEFLIGISTGPISHYMYQSTVSAGLSPKLFQMSNNEFVSAICRRSTFEDPMAPKRVPITSRDDSNFFSCGCDGGARLKSIDPFGYHLVGCKTGASAIRLHDEVVSLLARLFRCLRVDAIVA